MRPAGPPEKPPERTPSIAERAMAGFLEIPSLEGLLDGECEDRRVGSSRTGRLGRCLERYLIRSAAGGAGGDGGEIGDVAPLPVGPGRRRRPAALAARRYPYEGQRQCLVRD